VLSATGDLLYAVKVCRTSEPHNYEIIEVRTYTARRAQDLALENYPGCNADTLGVCIEGIWHAAAHDD
jgi:hypothetical protein